MVQSQREVRLLIVSLVALIVVGTLTFVFGPGWLARLFS